MGKFQRKHSCIPPEYIKCNQKYAISLNPFNQYATLKHSIDVLYKHLSETLGIEELVLYPEHSPTGRFHYHGTIVISDIFDFYHHTLPKFRLSYTFEIDSVHDPKVWEAYCSKNRHYMREPITALKDRSYPLLYKSVDAIFERQSKSVKYAEKRKVTADDFDKMLEFRKFDLNSDSEHE